ncbi:MAG: proton-conducting transporter membrane subunit [Acidobacteriota bacterium]
MLPQWLALALALLLPVFGAAAVAWAGRGGRAVAGKHRATREACTAVASIATFLCVAWIAVEVAAGERPRLEIGEVFPGLPIAFEVEPLGLLFALVASALWPVTSMYAVGYLRAHRSRHQTRFFSFFALSIAAALGIAFSANLLTLFLFYEALTLATYPLVTHQRTGDARRAGRLYLGILMGTSIFLLLPAILATYQIAGSLDFVPGGLLQGKIEGSAAAFLFALFAFGIGKAALMPVHRWLPAAMVAPTPVSALLHAVAVVKAGVFCVLKVTIYVFGLPLLQSTQASSWIGWVATFTLLATALVALTQDDLKARLAYSTISQLSYIVLGACLATAAGVLGGAMHIAMHALGKITLFFCAGAIYVAHHKRSIASMDGLGRRMPWTYLAFFIASLSIIGLPPTGGSWSKWLLVLGTVEGERWLWGLALLLSSLLSIGYLMPVVVRGLLRPEPGQPEGEDNLAGEGTWLAPPEERAEAPVLVLAPALLTAAGTLLLFFFASDLYGLLEPLVQTVAPAAGGSP